MDPRVTTTKIRPKSVTPPQRNTALDRVVPELANKVKQAGKTAKDTQKMEQGVVTAASLNGVFWVVDVDIASGPLKNVKCLNCTPQIGDSVWVTNIGGGRWMVLGSTTGGGGGLMGIKAIVTPVSLYSSASTTFVSCTEYTLTWTAEASRAYKIVLNAGVRKGTVEGDVAEIIIADAANTQLWTWRESSDYGNDTSFLTLSAVFMDIAAGSVTRKIRIRRASGTGTVYLYSDNSAPAWASQFWVEDIGAAI